MPPEPQKNDKKGPPPGFFSGPFAFPVLFIAAFLFILIFFYGYLGDLRRFTPIIAQITAIIEYWWVGYIAPVSVVLDTLLIGYVIFLLIQILPRRYNVSIFDRPRAKAKALDDTRRKVRVVRDWEAIRERSTVPTAQNLRLAIIDGDTLVDTFLKSAGYSGETMAERLQGVNPNDAPSLQRVWSAHKLRNELVHTPGFPLSPGEARSALKAFEDFLRELGGL